MILPDRHRATAAVLALALAWAAAYRADATAAIPGFAETVVTDSLVAPVAMAFLPDGRILVTEQRGRVRVIRHDTLLARPFVTVATHAEVEQGLLGIAIDPEFARNGWVYVCYTARAPRRNRIERFTASGDTALDGSGVLLFEMDAHVGRVHLGGMLRFAPDRTLFVGVGDDDDGAKSQSLRSTAGKLLRLRADGGIPDDNPFVATARGRHRAIWARGLRNPFGFDFDSTGRLFVNDVGGDRFEEVNVGEAGANYGAPMLEGPTAHEGLKAPFHSYSHAEGCAITGGAFYHPARPAFPDRWIGRYFFAEFCRSQIRWLDPDRPEWSGALGVTRIAGPVDLGVGPDGDLYYLARGSVNPVGDPAAPGGALVRVHPVAVDRMPTGR